MLAAGAGSEKGLAYRAHVRVADPTYTLPKPRPRRADSPRQVPTGVKWGPGHDLYDMIIKPKSKDRYQSKKGQRPEGQ